MLTPLKQILNLPKKDIIGMPTSRESTPSLFPVPSKWDKSIPVEKSSYLQNNDLTFLNKENFKLLPDKLTMIDLFCGAGGFSEGCSWAGFQSVFGVDHFAPAIKTWSLNHPNAICCLGDIKKLNPEYIKQLLDENGVKKVHLITGGVPCQGFSRANRKHIDHDERNYLFLEYMKFVRVFQPDYIILENVSGMRTTAEGQFERDIREYMESLDYKVSISLLNAADYGVPQTRQRLIFVGVHKNRGLTDCYTFPTGEFCNKHRTVSDAISDLPKIGNNGFSIQYASNPQNDFQKLMRGVGSIKNIKPCKIVHNHVAPNHPQETIDKIANTQPGAPMYPKFKQRIRLREDMPSPTQLAGGIRPQFQFGHPNQARGLSIRERARIQTFPDSYIFMGGIVQERVQTGNAVPPLLIYNIALPISEDIKNRDQHV